MRSISATYGFPALPAGQTKLVRPWPGAHQQVGSKWDTQQVCEGFGDQLRLIITSLPQSASVQRYWNNHVRRKILRLMFDPVGQATGEPRAEWSYVTVFQQENRARHSRCVRAETPSKVKGVHLASAKVALRLRETLGSGGGNNGPAALGAQRFGERLPEGRGTRGAERDQASGVEDLGADSTRRRKSQRRKRLAHSPQMGANGVGDSSHGTPSLRRSAH